MQSLYLAYLTKNVDGQVCWLLVLGWMSLYRKRFEDSNKDEFSRDEKTDMYLERLRRPERLRRSVRVVKL